MAYEQLLFETWSTDTAVVCGDTLVLAELIWAHLIHHFSTPGVLLSWSVGSPHRMRGLLIRIAILHPSIPPSCAIRAMLVVLSLKKTIKGGIAYGAE